MRLITMLETQGEVTGWKPVGTELSYISSFVQDH